LYNLYSSEDLPKLKEAASLASYILQELVNFTKPGVTTLDIENLAENLIKQNKATPLFKGYESFPFCTCLSVNQYIVHGMANANPLNSGDVISIDIGVKLNGYCGDNARTLIVGGQETEHSHLIEVTEAAFEAGLKAAVPGNTVGHVGSAVNREVSRHYIDPFQKHLGKKFKVFHKVFGHGIGRDLHEDPNIPNIGFAGAGTTLVEGMCICIEPVVLYDSSDGIIETMENTEIKQFYTDDGLPSAHYENQIYLTSNGPVIISKH